MSNLIDDVLTRSKTLSERVESLPKIDGSLTEEERERLDTWMENAAKGDREAFERRLEWLGVSSDDLGSILSNDGEPDPEGNPPGTDFLKSVHERIQGTDPEEVSFNRNDPHPYEECYRPFVERALERFRNHSPDNRNLVDERFYEERREELYDRLRTLTGGIFQKYFERHRSGENPLSVLLPETGEFDANSHERYDRFVRWYYESGFEEMIDEYPVFARNLVRICRRFNRAYREFLDRYRSDRKTIADAFFGGTDPGAIVSAGSDQADAHRQGRTTLQIEFASGQRVVYKPRDLRIDTVFGTLQERINEAADRTVFRPIGHVEREEYGWSEFIEHRPCENEDDVESYYWRAGGLLALAYAFRGSDLHHENIIAHGSFPVPVDLETVFQPMFLDEQEQEDGYSRASFSYSVFRTSLLGQELQGGSTEGDIGGFTAIEDETRRKIHYANINTDAMGSEYRNVRAEHKNAPLRNGDPQPLEEHLDPFLEGFRTVYELLEDHGGSFFGPDLRDRLREARPRFLYRDTNLYAKVQNRALNPSNLKSGIDRSITIDLLARPFYPFTEGRKLHREILVRERASMEALDIPFFTVRPGSLDLHTSVEPVAESFFDRTILESIDQGLDSLDEQDRALQVKLVRANVGLKTKPELEAMIDEAEAMSDPSELDVPSDDQLLTDAQSILDRILEQQISLGGDRRNWLTITVDPETEQAIPSLLGRDLYSGKPGLGLAYAALAKATGEERYERVAGDCFENLTALVEDLETLPARVGLGGVSGLGSMIYSLAGAGILLDDESLVNAAGRTTELIDETLVGRDEVLDVIGGSAGLLMSLLALHDVTGNPDHRSLARDCADHLVKKQVDAEPAGKAWESPFDAQGPLCGFSHGASGIATALVRFDRNGNGEGSKYVDAAIEGLRYEHALFDEDAMNWPDLRDHEEQPDDETFFMTTWCHGAPGIALARDEVLGTVSEDWIEEDRDHAVRTTLRYPLRGPDHVCCGNFGRLGILNDTVENAGTDVSRDDLKRRAKASLKRSRKDGFLLPSEIPGVMTNVGFFHGLSGIAYELLRLREPEAYPNVMRMESPR